MSTKIQYCDETWNPVVGCVPCGVRCYAARVAHRGLTPRHRALTEMGPSGPRFNGLVREVPEALEMPLRWRKPRVVLVPSMGDLFLLQGSADSYLAEIFGVMARAPRHTFLVLTKRPEKLLGWLDWLEYQSIGVGHGGDVCCTALEARIGPADRQMDACWPPRNVLLGVSVEDQESANLRLPPLSRLAADGWRTWISAEPLLGHIDFGRAWPHYSALPEWVAVGGETGPGARPCDPRWIQSAVQQCQAANVRVFVKQLGRDPDPDWHGLLTFRSGVPR